MYFTWLLVPLALLCHQFVPLLFFPVTNFMVESDVERVLITSRQTLAQINDANWLVISSVFITIFLSVLTIIDHWQFRRTLLAAPRCLTDRIIKHHQTEVAKRRIRLFVSDHVESPMLVGFLRPKLILPSNFSDLYNQEQQQLIVAHEICHFDRNDIYWNLFAFAFIALFWFHPLVWMAYIRFRRDQELSCDQTTLASKPLESRINYSRALLITAQQKQRFSFAHLSFNEYGDKKVMLERITQIKHCKVLGKSTFALYGLLVAALMTSVSYAGHIGQQGNTGDKQLKTINDVYPTMRVEPKYPIQAARDDIEGAVLLKFDVDPQGNTENIRVVAASPENVFDKVAIDALQQWKYASTSKSMSKNHIVQLDFMTNESTSQPIHLVERIKVSK
jgi:TonB family protein